MVKFVSIFKINNFEYLCFEENGSLWKLEIDDEFVNFNYSQLKNGLEKESN